jgi:hypothetical protein
MEKEKGVRENSTGDGGAHKNLREQYGVMRVRTTGELALALAVIALFPTAIVAQAREPTVRELGYSPSNYWSLYIHMQPAFCAKTAMIQVTGPFGHQEESNFTNAKRTAGTGVVIEYVVRLDLTKKDFPSGNQYEIGIGAPDLCSPTKTPFVILNATSTGGSQYYSYSYNDGNPTLVPMLPQNGTGH